MANDRLLTDDEMVALTIGKNVGGLITLKTTRDAQDLKTSKWWIEQVGKLMTYTEFRGYEGFFIYGNQWQQLRKESGL